MHTERIGPYLDLGVARIELELRDTVDGGLERQSLQGSAPIEQ